jgi:serine phosphatase RsbU (regulator of sigma subunit)/ligand-binding sensor domain-containing protein
VVIKSKIKETFNSMKYSMFKNITVTFVIMFAATNLVFAQLNPNNLVQFTEIDGVPGAQVSKILIDKFGYVWIGTINGLARYDGYEFKRFYNDPNDTNSIKGLIIWSLFEDSKGRIWIASSPENLNLYDQVSKSFLHYEFKHLIDRPANVEIGISNICEDNKGRIYFGVNAGYNEPISSSLLYFDEAAKKVKKYIFPDSLGIRNIYGLKNDNKGNVYFFCSIGLFKIDTERNLSRVQVTINELEKTGEYLTDFLCDANGHIWAVTNKLRLVDLDPVSGNYKIFASNDFNTRDYDENNWNVLEIDNAGKIYIGSGNGILYFDRRGEKFVGFNDQQKNPIKNEIIRDLKLDSFGSLWIGTSFGGLFKYEDRTLFKSYRFNPTNKNSLTQGWANNIYETHDKKIWVTTSGQGNSSGINIVYPRTGEIKPITFQELLPGSEIIFSLIEISPGELLISTGKGNYKYDTKSLLVEKAKLNGIPDSLFIRKLYKDSFDNLWLGSFRGLYKKLKSTDKFERYDLSLIPGSNVSSNHVKGIYESKKHGLWLLTPFGLYTYDYKSDKISRHGFDRTTGEVLVSQDINSIYEDSNGIMWIGTWQGGLSRYDVSTKKIKTYTRNDGLPSMSIQGILSDEENNTLWLSTFDGLSLFNTKTEKFNNFSIADGIQSQLFSDGSYFKSSQGYYFFGGANGITIFTSNDINSNSIPPKVFLTDFKLFNKSIIPGSESILKKPIYESKEIVLAHDQNNISIEFTTLHYSNPKKNKTLYKLDNYENIWRDAGNQLSAFYPNLPPGEYVFRVKAANNNGIWDEQGATLKIIVTSPWWQTWWAYSFYFFAIAGIIGGVRKYELDRRREKENKKLAQLENDRKTKELEEARQLQLSMLPKVLPQLPNLDIAVYMKTATEVGGDYYDFIVGLDGSLTVAIGDATGHGMKAGTIVSMIKALFASGGSKLSMKIYFEESSNALKGIELGRLMMAFMMIKIKSNRIEIANAGMPPLYVYRNKTKEIEEILLKGMPLGALKDFPYEILETEITPGDILLMLSDGLPELKNEKNEQFGYEKVKEIFKSAAESTPEEIIGILKDESMKWSNDNEPDDDITFVVIKVK